jgi:site-specific DNA-methyltransferase (adenine-specific)
LIRTYTNPGDLVLDPTAGALTTAVAAHNTGRRAVCVELLSEYVDLGIRRLTDAGADFCTVA